MMKKKFKINSATRISDGKIFFIGDCFEMPNEVSARITDFGDDGFTVYFLLFLMGLRVTTHSCPIDEFEKHINSIEFSEEAVSMYREIKEEDLELKRAGKI